MKSRKYQISCLSRVSHYKASWYKIFFMRSCPTEMHIPSCEWHPDGAACNCPWEKNDMGLEIITPASPSDASCYKYSHSELRRCKRPFNGWSCYLVHALRTTLQPHDGAPLYDSSFALRSCCSFRKPHVGSHFITVLFIHGAVPTRWTSLLTDAWDNWGYDDGRSMRFPLGLSGPCSDGGRVIGRSHWTTHTSKTNYSLTVPHDVTTVTTAAAHNLWSFDTLANSTTTTTTTTTTFNLRIPTMTACQF
jgi:hypothetical protein